MYRTGTTDESPGKTFEHGDESRVGDRLLWCGDAMMFQQTVDSVIDDVFEAGKHTDKIIASSSLSGQKQKQNAGKTLEKKKEKENKREICIKPSFCGIRRDD
jgi:hypothetical protein